MPRHTPEQLTEGPLEDAFAAKSKELAKLAKLFQKQPQKAMAEDKFLAAFKEEFLRLCDRFDLPVPPAFNKSEQATVGFDPDGKPGAVGVRLNESSLREDPEMTARQSFGRYVLGLGNADQRTRGKLCEMLGQLFTLDRNAMGAKPIKVKKAKR